jgi:hypothetical protein
VLSRKVKHKSTSITIKTKMPATTRNPRQSDAANKLNTERNRLQQERQAAEKELQRQRDIEKEKRQAKKKKRDKQQKIEEELRKKTDDERRKQEEANRATISPDDPTRRNRSDSDGDDSIDRLLQYGADMELDTDIEEKEKTPAIEKELVLQSPPKKSARFASEVRVHAPNPSKATTKPLNASLPKKSALKTQVHKHAHPRIIVESSIQLPAKKPEDHFIVALRELLRNGTIVDKHFAFAPVKKGDGDYLITDNNSIPTNMTVLSKHFKVSYQGTRNPFEKQKVWNKNKKDKD